MKKIEKVVFGGGCFWCTEATFKMLNGVISVLPGYAGGIKSNPTYEEVSSGTTGHAEVAYVEYDPQKITFRDLLAVFFATHDPTTPDRQGNDIGTQYRSIIFYTNSGQKDEANRFIEELNKSDENSAPIITEVRPLEKFYQAEEYHHDYYRKNPTKAYCRVIINPKLKKVQKTFARLLKDNEK